MFPFHVLGGAAIREIIEGSRPAITARVRDTYLAHHRGATINPASCFLRFPDKPDARIIALPAVLRDEPAVAGLKWIGSFPGNVAANVPRASAVLLLNDLTTGYPFACLEAAQISAARTAASAVLGAEQLCGGRRAGKVAVIGAGVISRAILDFLHDLGWQLGQVVVYDRVAGYAEKSAEHARTRGFPAAVSASLTETTRGADLVVLATTAAEPYIVDDDFFAAGQAVLNISLRDIGPRLIARAHNVLDDIDHCLSAGTSPELAVRAYGHREFIDGTLAQLMLADIALGHDRARIFSPFGLGVLDLAVGMEIFTTGLAAGQARGVPDFFAEVTRW